MAKDAPLQAALAKCASESQGRVKFRVLPLRELAAELGIDLGPAKANPIYEFQVSLSTDDNFRCVAYTNVIDGSKRPATRVEALGRGLAAEDGKLFDSNPFLVVFDYVGGQSMAVAASKLFGAFAQVAASRALPKADTAAFSMTPNFNNRTISMYGNVDSSSIWVWIEAMPPGAA